MKDGVDPLVKEEPEVVTIPVLKDTGVGESKVEADKEEKDEKKDDNGLPPYHKDKSPEK